MDPFPLHRLAPSINFICFGFKHIKFKQLWTLISDHSNPYKFLFYCPPTHVMSQVLQPESVNKQ